MQRLNWTEKMTVYFVGVMLGILLLVLINRWRHAGRDDDDAHRNAVSGMIETMITASGLRNLPEASPAYLRQSELAGYIMTQPDAEGRHQYIWVLRVAEGHPWIRVVEELELAGEAEPTSLSYTVMTADEVLVRPVAGLDRRRMEQRLAAMGYELRTYLAGESAWSVGISNTPEVFSVPKAIQRLSRQSESDWVREVQPRYIHWR